MGNIHDQFMKGNVQNKLKGFAYMCQLLDFKNLNQKGYLEMTLTTAKNKWQVFIRTEDFNRCVSNYDINLLEPDV